MRISPKSKLNLIELKSCLEYEYAKQTLQTLKQILEKRYSQNRTAEQKTVAHSAEHKKIMSTIQDLIHDMKIVTNELELMTKKNNQSSEIIQKDLGLKLLLDMEQSDKHSKS